MPKKSQINEYSDLYTSSCIVLGSLLITLDGEACIIMVVYIDDIDTTTHAPCNMILPFQPIFVNCFILMTI